MYILSIVGVIMISVVSRIMSLLSIASSIISLNGIIVLSVYIIRL